MPSPSPSGFFRLPRELRDSIYRLYVFEPEGYHIHLASGKLRASGNRPINLALMRTCTTVAAEMHHLPLRSNVLHFSTSTDPSESERTISARFDMLLSYMHLGRVKTLDSLKWLPLRRYQTPDVNAKLALKYPPFAPLLCQPYDQLACFNIASEPASSWGEADSSFIAFQSYMIELLSTDTDFREALANFYEKDYARTVPSVFANNPEVWLWEGEDARERDEYIRSHAEQSQQTGREEASLLRSVLSMSSPDPWMIPSDDELAELNTSAGFSAPNLGDVARGCLGLYEDREVKGTPWKRVRWRFSAAAAAVRFFKSISPATCLGIRKVVLHEHRRSVARPESHVLGLIPFCVQNPQLHIERRVNIWGTLLADRPKKKTWSLHFQAKELVQYSGQDEGERWDTHGRFCLSWIGTSFCQWITEASALSANGMPAHSFTLVFDGDPAPDQSSELFEVVKEDAAWQVARAQWYNNQSGRRVILQKRRGAIYKSEVFPQAINDIVEGKSFISCNFPTGNLHDPQQVLNITRHISYDPTSDRDPDHEWWIAWMRPRLHTPFQLSPPLPSLSELTLEDLISEEQPDAA